MTEQDKTAARRRARKAAASKAAAPKPAGQTEQDKTAAEQPRVTVNDPAADRRKRDQEEADKVAEGRRLAHVQALETERDFLTRQPSPNGRRLAEVQRELDHFSSSPKERRRELAVDVPTTSVTEQHAQAVPDRTPSTPDQQSVTTG